MSLQSRVLDLANRIANEIKLVKASQDDFIVKNPTETQTITQNHHLATPLEINILPTTAVDVLKIREDTNVIFKVSGQGVVQAAAYNNLSDARLKENIQVIDDPIDRIHQIRGCTYSRIDLNENQAGVIAQEVMSVLPEAVTERDDNIGTLSVDYSGIVALLVECVKNLDIKNKELENINALLNDRLDKIESKVDLISHRTGNDLDF